MEIKANVSLHNKFEIKVLDAETEEVIQEGYAENIVLNRMYERLCMFNTYFTTIVFGSGTGELSVSRDTLFNKIDSKTAEDVEKIRGFPTSKWTRKIRLGASEYNGQFIRELGISETSTYINTHALVVDSEDEELEIEKTSAKIVDIYATVFAILYDVDSGLYWYDDGLQRYLTGDTIASEQIGVSYIANTDGGGTIINGTRSYNASEKWVKSTATFSELQHNNKDIATITWRSLGLACVLPRTGVFENWQRNDVYLGVGDGETKIFTLPNDNIHDIILKVDGETVSSGFALNGIIITFDIAPDEGLEITADYKCDWIPKDENHILKVIFTIQYGADEPQPVMPDLIIPTTVPGETTVIKGTSNYGYFGVVSANELISGNDLCNMIGLTAGNSQFSDAGWLKYSIGGKPLFVAKKTIRHSISWDNINAVEAVFGDKIIILNGVKYAVRLLSTQEWDRLIYPVHIDHYNGAPEWDNFEDIDIQVNYSVSGNGCSTWTSTASGSYRVYRGSSSVSGSSGYTPSVARYNSGFRPVLEFFS